MVVVQHIAAGGFVQSLVQWFQRDSRSPVEILETNTRLSPGVTYFAPDGHHLKLQETDGYLHSRLSLSPPRSGFRPSIDILFESVAETLGPNAVGMLLTGMGRDGAAGLLELRKQGALTLSQDQESCIVYGMPQEAERLGAVCHSLSPSGLVEAVKAALNLKTS